MFIKVQWETVESCKYLDQLTDNMTTTDRETERETERERES